MKQLKAVNDFVVKFANVNGSGSASANELFARAILRMGVPVSPRNIFPSNIQGLPTWYEVRVNENGYQGRRGGVDLMVAMNPADVGQRPEGDRARRLPLLRQLQAAAEIEVPRGRERDRHAAHRDLQRDLHRSAPAPALQEHHLRRRAVRAARHRSRGNREAFLGAVQRQGSAAPVERESAAARPRLRARRISSARLGSGCSARTTSATRSSSTATALRRWARSTAARRVCAWYPITPSSSLAEAFIKHCQKLRVDPATGKNKFAIIQGEDELASIGIAIGAGWNGARAFTATSGPGISLMTGVHRARLFRGNPGGADRRPARRAFDRHADPHPAVGRDSRAPTPRTATPSTCCCSRKTRPSASSSRRRLSISPSGCKRRSSS